MTTHARQLLVLFVLGRASSLGSSPFSGHARPRIISSRLPTLAVSFPHDEKGLTLNPLVTDIEPSKTIEVHALTMAMKARGEEVISLAVGEPDFDPPEAVLEATKNAVSQGLTRYTAVSGTAKLRAAISQHLKTRKGTAYTPDEILVCNGAKQVCPPPRARDLDVWNHTTTPLFRRYFRPCWPLAVQATR